MSRRRRAEKREILPDPKFNDLIVTKFMNYVMHEGKKAVAENIIYAAFDILEAKRRDIGPLETFHSALDNVSPSVEVKSRRVGGATHPVPVEVPPNRRRGPPLPGPGRSPAEPSSGARDPLAGHRGAQARRKQHDRKAGRRAVGRLQQP